MRKTVFSKANIMKSVFYYLDNNIITVFHNVINIIIRKGEKFFAESLQETEGKNKLTDKAICEATGIKQSTLSDWLSGRSVALGADKAIALAKGFLMFRSTVSFLSVDERTR